MKLIFATNNQHKVQEIKKGISADIDLVSLKEAGIIIDIPEPFDTLKDNASEKSQTIHQLTHQNCFSEDTGLEVNALNGAPGVKSARYSGEHATDTENINKLLGELAGKSDRTAQFRTVISLIWQEKEYWFEGTCPGVITESPSGDQGFGYDPVFIPDGSDRTFAQMNMEEKRAFSHRQKATQKLIDFLRQQHP